MPFPPGFAPRSGLIEILRTEEESVLVTPGTVTDRPVTVTIRVTTNAPGGYRILLQGPVLAADPGSREIAVGVAGIPGRSPAAVQAALAEQARRPPQVVYQSSRPTGPDGDVIELSLRFEADFQVPAGSYSQPLRFLFEPRF